MKTNFAIESFDVVSFQEAKPRTQKKKEKEKKKEPKKKKNKKEEIKKKTRERDRGREIEQVEGQKRLRRNKGRHSKINKKCPFQGENWFFVTQKQRKETKNNPPKKTQTNKPNNKQKQLRRV